MAEPKTPFHIAVDEFCTALKRRKIKGSMPTARRTAEILRMLIATRKHPDGAAVIEDVKFYGSKMQGAKPLELAIGNMVRRVLSLIRDEHVQEANDLEFRIEAPSEEQPAGSSTEGALSKAFKAEAAYPQVGLHNLLDVGPVSPFFQHPSEAEVPLGGSGSWASAAGEGGEQAPLVSPGSGLIMSTTPSRKHRNKAQQWKNKPNVIETVNELIEELDMIESQIITQGPEHIHSNEIILTMNYSHMTFKFLQEAAKKRLNFQVVVAEGAPDLDGHRMAKLLADSSIHTTAINDAAVFAMMARVNKVIMGAHAVLANGGVVAPVGSHLVALAARRHAVPFVVLVGLHKLSPLFPHAPDVAFNDFRSPGGIISFDSVAEGASAGPHGGLHISNPQYDYIPPELVTIIVTDTGGYTPSYVYRLLAEYYKREDYNLSPDPVIPAAA